MKRAVRRYVLFARHHAIALFFLFALLFVVQFFHVRSVFSIDTDLTALFRGDNPTVRDLEAVEARIGTFETMLVVSESSEPEKNRAFMDDLEQRIVNSELVTSVEYRRDVSVIEDHVLLYLPLETLEHYHVKIRDIIKKEVKKRMWSSDTAEKNDDPDDVKRTFGKTLDDVVRTLEKKRHRHDITTYRTAADGQYLAMKVRPRGSATSVGEIKKLRQFIQEQVDTLDPGSYGVSVQVGGRLQDKVKEMNAMTTDLLTTLLLCVGLLTLIIVFYFRTLTSFFIVMLPLTAGILSSLSITLLFIDNLNIVSAFSYVVLYGLGIDFGIHLLSRYGEEKYRLGDVRRALMTTMTEVVPAMFFGAVTTAAAFSSLMLLDFKGFFDYGLVATVGILAAFTAYVLFFPVFILMVEVVVPVRVRPRKVGVLFSVQRILASYRKPLLIAALVFTGVSVLAMMHVPFEYNLNKLRFEKSSDSGAAPDNSLIVRYNRAAKKEQRDTFSRGLSAVYLTDSHKEADRLTRYLEGLKKRYEESPNRIKGILSLQTFVPPDQKKKLRVIKRMERLITRKKNLLDEEDVARMEKEIMPLLAVRDTIDADDLPTWIRDKFREKDGSTGKVVMVLTSGSKNDIENVRRIRDRYGYLTPEEGRTYTMAGAFLLLSDIYDILHEDVPLSGVLALITVFITLLVMFRSLRRSLTVLLPLVAGFLWLFSVTWVLDIRFNLFNMVIVPTVLGIGIDSSIHLYHRYLSHRTGAGLAHTLATTGGAVLFSSLTTLVGFLSLTVSAHRGISSMGEVATVGIITVALAALVVFPQLLSVFHARRDSPSRN